LTPEFDVLLVGCGLRGTGLLTAVPELLGRRLGIVEAGQRLGPGSFAHYRIQSNSSGSDFFGWVQADGPFADVLRASHVRALREHKGAFDLQQLALVLESFGNRLRQLVAPERLVLGDPAVSLHVNRGRIKVRLRSGRELCTRYVVLATGIREAPHPDLQAWQAKRVLSGDIIRRGHEALTARNDHLRVVVIGASHSTYAVARVLQANLPAGGHDLVIVHRNPVKLFYRDAAEYAATARSGIEAIPDLSRDACPETGNLFRYSGLRHGALAMFRKIAAGEVPHMRHERVGSIAEAAPLLDAADVVVQATGYESNTFDLWLEGEPCTMRRHRRVVDVSEDGRLVVPGPSSPNIFVMGMDPYPYNDNSVTPSSQYARRGRQLLAALAADDAVAEAALSSI